MSYEISSSYMAGVADSDGSFSIAIRHRNRPNPTYQAMFQLSWSLNFRTKSIMMQLVSKYGGSFYEPKMIEEQSYKNTKQIIKYTLTGKKLKKFLKDIKPHILLKYDQVNNLLELLNTTEFGRYGFGRPKPEELKKQHHELYLNNKKLNTKNSGDRRKIASI